MQFHRYHGNARGVQSKKQDMRTSSSMLPSLNCALLDELAEDPDPALDGILPGDEESANEVSA
jgi:hypothetical protein